MMSRGRGMAGCRGRGVWRFRLQPGSTSIGVKKSLSSLPVDLSSSSEPPSSLTEVVTEILPSESSVPMLADTSTSSETPLTLPLVPPTSLSLSVAHSNNFMEPPLPENTSSTVERSFTLTAAPSTSMTHYGFQLAPSFYSQNTLPFSPVPSIPFVPPPKKSKSGTSNKKPINYPTKTTNFVEFFLSQRLGETQNLDQKNLNPVTVSKPGENQTERKKFNLFESVSGEGEEIMEIFSTVGKFRRELRSVSRAISVGDEILCVPSGVNGPSEVYLVRDEDWPQRLDNIIISLRNFYSNLKQTPMRYKWIPELADIKPGLLVAIYKFDEKDWFRGCVLPQKKNQIVGFHHVQVLDTGETQDIPASDIYYLDTFFMKEPELAIKCRLALGKNFDKLHSGEMMWPPVVHHKLCEATFDRRYYAKFHRRVMHRGEGVWEVTMNQVKNEFKNEIQIETIIHEAAKQLGISSK